MKEYRLKVEIAQRELSDLVRAGYSGTKFNNANPKSAIENRKSSSGESGIRTHGG